MSVSTAFDKARADNRAALVGYLPAGFPTVARSVDAFHAMVDAGVDLVEVGMPYSDPVMDGPVIQAAADRALANGLRTRDVLDVVSKVAGYGVPTVIMTYWNPVERYGVDAFARDLAGAGGSGLITPDLIPDEAGEWLAASDAYQLDRIFLVAPSSTDARIASTTAACRGFVYATSVMGVTGARETDLHSRPGVGGADPHDHRSSDRHRSGRTRRRAGRRRRRLRRRRDRRQRAGLVPARQR